MLCGAWACLVASCTYNVAGSVTEGGNVAIGTVVDANGKGIAGVQVALRPSDFLADTAGAPPPRHTSANAVTDSKGRFKLDSIDAGQYCISATSGESLAVKWKVEFQPGVFTDTTLAATRIKAAAKIDGIVVNQAKTNNATYVRVYGLDRIARVDSVSGRYALGAIPEGTYQLQIDVSSQLFKPVPIPNISCTNGEDKTIDTIAIAPFYGEDYSLWSNTLSIKLNTTAGGANIANTITGIPVLVRLRSPTIAFGQCLPDGRDLRFANSKGIHLPFEIERFDPNAQIADVWVLVDTVKGNDSTFLSVYWGNANAATQSMSSTVFDTALGYVAVWHLNDRALNDRRDATGSGNNAVPAPGTYEGDEWTYGLIGGCDSLDDNDDHLVAPQLNGGGAITLSMWVNLYELTASLKQYFIGKAGPVVDKPPLYSLMLNDKNQLAMNVTTAGKPDSLSGGSIVLNAWYYVVGTYDGAMVRIYVNGAQVSSKAVLGNFDTSATNLNIGCYDRASQKTHGKIDEVRILRSAQSADWVKLNYENQKENGTLVTFGN